MARVKTFTRGQTTATTFGRATPRGEFALLQVQRDIGRIERGEANAGVGIVEVTTPQGETTKGVVTQKLELERVEVDRKPYDVPKLRQTITTPKGMFLAEQPIVSGQLSTDYARQARQQQVLPQQPTNLGMSQVTGQAAYQPPSQDMGIKQRTGQYFTGLKDYFLKEDLPRFKAGASEFGANVFGFANQQEAQRSLEGLQSFTEKRQQELNLARATDQNMFTPSRIGSGVIIGATQLVSLPATLVARPKETIKTAAVLGTPIGLIPTRTDEGKLRPLASQEIRKFTMGASLAPETAFFGTALPALFFVAPKLGGGLKKLTTVKYKEPVTTKIQTVVKKRSFIPGKVKGQPDVLEFSRTKLEFQQPRTLKIVGIKKEIPLTSLKGQADLKLLVEGKTIKQGAVRIDGKTIAKAGLKRELGVTVLGGEVRTIKPGFRFGFDKGKFNVQKISMPKDIYKIKTGAGELLPKISKVKATMLEKGGLKVPATRAFYKQPQLTPTGGKIKILLQGKKGESLASLSPREQLIFKTGKVPSSAEQPYGIDFYFARGKGQAFSLSRGRKVPKAVTRQFKTTEQIVDIGAKSPKDMLKIDFLLKPGKMPKELSPNQLPFIKEGGNIIGAGKYLVRQKGGIVSSKQLAGKPLVDQTIIKPLGGFGKKGQFTFEGLRQQAIKQQGASTSLPKMQAPTRVPSNLQQLSGGIPLTAQVPKGFGFVETAFTGRTATALPAIPLQQYRVPRGTLINIPRERDRLDVGTGIIQKQPQIFEPIQTGRQRTGTTSATSFIPITATIPREAQVPGTIEIPITTQIPRTGQIPRQIFPTPTRGFFPQPPPGSPFIVPFLFPLPKFGGGFEQRGFSFGRRQKRQYLPSLIGLTFGQPISKAPAGFFSGAEIRFPVIPGYGKKRKKSRRKR